MNSVFLNIEKKQVTVQAGCHLGMDPFDPTGSSDIKNSLFYQLDQAGLAVPDMGGIIHQTVGGFLSTGSAGGSVFHSFGEQLIALKLIDGNGEIHYVTREGNDDLFFAAGVSMGLLGIITEATFQCIDKFNIMGEETTTPVEDCSIDLFGEGSDGSLDLESFLHTTEYARLMWWPQKKIHRVVIWKAHQMKESDYTSGDKNNDFIPKPYQEFPLINGTELPAEAAGGLFYSTVGNWHLGMKKMKVTFPLNAVLSLLSWLYPVYILPAVVKKFIPLDQEKKPPGSQQFRDTWWHGLPMDNRVSDRLMPTEFTEMWIPLSKAAYTLQKLRGLYDLRGHKATGSYACEVYAAKKSRFWLSPSYNEDVIRINIIWFGYNSGNPIDNYYPQFWKMFMDDESITCRFHWGKHMPLDPHYIRKQYPKWDDFLSMCKRFDPNRIFLTDYWQRYLGL